MRRAQRLYADTTPELGLEADLFALDATVIELSMALFPWARWKKTLASVKLNVLLDLRGDIPVFASLYEGKRHEVASLDELPVQPGSYYVMDRGYLDFSRLYRLHQAGAFFVTRLKTNTAYYVAESRPIDQATGLRCDQTIKLNSLVGQRDYPEKLRRISFVDPETGNTLVFVTNQFDLPALLLSLIHIYATFVADLCGELNRKRGPKVIEELKSLRPLPSGRFPDTLELSVAVSNFSTVRVKKCAYSVPARLIGTAVRAYVSEKAVVIHHLGQEVARHVRVTGKRHQVNYRHVIKSLVRKPGAFARCQYREDLFPQLAFRQAYELSLIHIWD